MNIRKLENYMEWCADEGTLPTIQGLKEYDYQAELKSRILSHVEMSTQYSITEEIKIGELLEFLKLTTADLLSGTTKETNFTEYDENNKTITRNILDKYGDMLYN